MTRPRPAPQAGPVLSVSIVEPKPIEPASRGPAEDREGPFAGLRFDAELGVLLVVFLGLCYGFTVLRPIPSTPRLTATASPPKEVQRADVAAAPANHPRFAFAGPQAAFAIIAPKPRPVTPMAAPSSTNPSPTETASVERHALIADPSVDPLGAVLLSGLPEGFHLSAGSQLSPSDWALAFADLDNLVIRLPRSDRGPHRTTLDLRTRSGVRIHSFTVEWQPEETPAVGSALPATPQPAVSPRTTTSKSGRQNRKGTRRPRTADAPPLVQKIAAKPPTKAAQNSSGASSSTAALVAGSKTPAATPSPDATKAAVPDGFFKPDPKDSSQAGLTSKERDDPRFTILRGLGMGPVEP